jgi:hypothetical protein
MPLSPVLDGQVLKALLAEADPAVTIMLSIAPAGDDPHVPATELRRLIDQAAAVLDRRGVDRVRRDAIVARARDLAGGIGFAQHRDPGIALFLTDSGGHVVSLPERPPEAAVVVGRHFYLKPLLPMLARDRRFNVLALSAAKARLLRATPYAWEELPLDALPPEVEATAIAMEDEARSRGETVNAASQEELRRSLVTEQLRTIAYAVRKQLADDEAPIVLAAEPQAAGHFRKLAGPHLGQLQEAELHLNPFALSDANLHARAVEVMRPLIDSELDAALDRIEARLGTAEPTVAIRLEEILAAAHEGRVDTVIVAENETLWGHFDPASNKLTAHGTQGQGEEDMVNEAAVATLRTGGRAFAVPHERMPRRVPAAALLRY